jgi:NADH-quinone oxidoreductase subunit M
MPFSTAHLLLLLVLSPLLGTVLAVMLRRQPASVVRGAVLTSSFGTALIATGLHVWFRVEAEGFHAAVPWFSLPRATTPTGPFDGVPWLEVVLSLGLDEWNAGLLLWIPWLAWSALLVTVAPEQHPVPFYGLFGVWVACLLGACAAADAITFCLCDAGALWLGYSLAAGWGGAERRSAAARFWRYQFAGQLAWWIGLTALGVVATWCRYDVLPALPTLRWTWPVLTERLPMAVVQSWGAAQYWESVATGLFLLLTVGAALRTPLPPWHGWLPGYLSAAPAAVGVLTLAAWCPLGVVLWLRLATPVFPQTLAGFGFALTAFAAVAAVYAGVLAVAAADLRRLSAYALMSLQAIAWLSVGTATTTGVHGALALGQAAGIGSAAWLMLVALRERRGSNDEQELPNALPAHSPRWAGVWMIVMLLACGFPAVGRGGTDLLVGWTLMQSSPWGMLAAMAALLLVSGAMLSTRTRMLFADNGEVRPPTVAIPHDPVVIRDLSATECLAFAPLLAWCVVGWYAPPTVPVPASKPGFSESRASRSDRLPKSSETSEVSTEVRAREGAASSLDHIALQTSEVSEDFGCLSGVPSQDREARLSEKPGFETPRRQKALDPLHESTPP